MRPSAPQSSVRLRSRSGAKKKTGSGPARPEPPPRSSRWVMPTAELCLQLVPEVAVDRAAHLGVARHVDVDGRLPIDRVELLVRDDPVVDAERLGELDVPGRGQADHFDSIAPGEQIGERRGGAARGAGQHCGLRSEHRLVVEEVIDQERGEVEGPEQHLLVLVLLLVEGHAGDADVAVVGGGEVGAMRARHRRSRAGRTGPAGRPGGRRGGGSRRSWSPRALPRPPLATTSAKPQTGIRAQGSSAGKKLQ